MHIHLFQIMREGTAGLSALSEDAGWMVLRPLPDQDQHQRWQDDAIIRYFLTHQPLEENALYGFFTPAFFEETQLSVAAIEAFIAQYPQQDAYVFPVPSAATLCYWHVFEQGDTIAPGLKNAAQVLISQLYPDISLDTLPMPLSRTVLNYYVVARPAVWQQWLSITEKIILPLSDSNGFTVLMKRLLTERLLSLVLTLDQTLRVTHYDLHALPCRDKAFLPYLSYASSLDTLKRAYQLSRQQKHADHFMTLRKTILDRYLHQHTAATLPVQKAVDYVCLTDTAMTMTYPTLVKPLYMGEYQQEGRLNSRDLAPEWEKWYPAVGELAGMIAFKNNLIKSRSSASTVGLCRPHKFIAQRYADQQTVFDTQPQMISSSAYSAEALKAMMLPERTDLLIAEPVILTNGHGKQSYLQHFGQLYQAADLLTFAAAAADVGILTQSEQQAFLDETCFYPGGCGLGVFPVDFWIQTVSAAEILVRQCQTKMTASASSHPRAVWAICAEYLMSYRLNQYVVTHYPQKQDRRICFGQCMLVSDRLVPPLSVTTL